MTEKSSLKGSLSRRNFLKVGGATAGVLGLAGAASMTTTDGWLSPAQAEAEVEEYTAITYHQAHCGGCCSFECTVRDGRLCHLEPNKAVEDEMFRTCCVKGLSEIQGVYGEGRIQTPLKLVGERDSNEYVSITWDEALDIFKEKIETIWAEDGKDAVYVQLSSEAGKTLHLLAPMLGAQFGGLTGIDHGIANGLDPMLGDSAGTTNNGGSSFAGGYSCMTADARDMVNSDFILNVGLNFVETNLMQSARFFDAKEAGAYIVTVDPHFCTTAQKSDEWVPIEPGSDAALYMGMTTVILENKLYNEEFVLNKTAYPFLVNVNTGVQLRVGEEAIDELTGAAVDTGDFMVWDTAEGKAVRHDTEGVVPALEGIFTYEGEEYTTVFSMLVENQKEYTLEWAEAQTAIPAEKIVELATRYAQANTAGIMTGWGGVDKMTNSDIAGRGLGQLVALTGHVGRPGSYVGCPAEAFSGATAGMGSWQFPSGLAAAPAECAQYELYKGENKIRAYVSGGDAATMRMPDMNSTLDWLKSLDFICVLDIYFNNARSYADLILPICSKFEAEDDIARMNIYNGYVKLGKKVLDPLFESKSDFRAQIAIAEALGLGAEMPKDPEEFISCQLSTSTDPQLAGITVDSLLANGQAQALPANDVPIIAYTTGFGTSSQKMHVYNEALLEYGHCLPKWETNLEVFPENELKAEYPLQFMQIRTKVRLHNQFWASSWINESFPCQVELNSINMQERDLEDGDTVKIYNSRSSMTCKVVTNESVRPGVLRVIEGVWDDDLDGGGFQYLTNPAMLDRSPLLKSGGVLPFNDTLCEVEKA